jgi:hypothetical protein
MDREAIAAIYRELEPFIRQVGQSDLIGPDFYLTPILLAALKVMTDEKRKSSSDK